jgi:hypothetical protein
MAMARYSIGKIVEEIRVLADSYDPDADESSITSRRFRIDPPVPWDRTEIENRFGVTIPRDLEELWNRASALHIFMFGAKPEETGVEIYPPSKLAQLRTYADSFPLARYLRADDLVIGADHVLWDFLVVIRCNPAMSDFGYVFVTQEMDARHEWVYAAYSLGEFLRRYLDANGEEYWQTATAPHVLV